MRYTDIITEKTSLYTDLDSKVQIQDFFGDIHKHPSFKDLYISRGPKKITDVEVDLLSRISEVNMVNWREFCESHGEESEITQLVADNIVKEKQKHFTIELLAPIGQGKTTFLHYFLYVLLPELSDSLYSATSRRYRFEPIVFDFRSGHIDESAKSLSYVIYRYINSEIEKRFDCFANNPKDHNEYYNTTHKIDLEIFSEILNEHGIGPEHYPINSMEYKKQCEIIVAEKEKDFFTYLSNKLTFVLSRYPNTIVIFAIDNIDHYYERYTPDARYILQLISNNLNISTIIAMRDTTYRLMVADSMMSVWEEPVMLVLPPLEAKVLGKRRLEILNKKISDQLSKEHMLYQFLAQIIHQMNPKFHSSTDLRTIWDWLENLGNGDLRLFLGLSVLALKSDLLTSDDFKNEYGTAFQFDQRPNKNINVKRFKAAFINGLTHHFFENISHTPVVNLFDHSTPDFKYHYIFRLKILQYLAKYKSAFFNIGYEINKLANILGPEIYKSHIESVFHLFICKRIISLEIEIETEENNDSVKQYHPDISGFWDIHNPRIQNSMALVSPNGLFHINNLIFDDVYLDMMKYSTDHNEEIFNSVFPDNSLENKSYYRKASTRKFIEHVEKAENESINLSQNLQAPRICNDIKDRYNHAKSEEEYFYGYGIAKSSGIIS